MFRLRCVRVCGGAGGERVCALSVLIEHTLSHREKTQRSARGAGCPSLTIVSARGLSMGRYVSLSVTDTLGGLCVSQISGTKLAGKDTAAAAAREDASTITSAAEQPPALAARRVFTHRIRLLALGNAIGEAGLGGKERVLLLGLCNDAVDVPGSGSGSGSGLGFTFGLEFGFGLKVSGSEFGRRLRLGRAIMLWLWLYWRGLRT